MIKQRFLFLLILILLVTPVISVFSHYSSMESPLLTVMNDSIDDAANAVSPNADQCQQHTKSKLSCDTNSLCSFSVCGYGGIVAAFLILTLAYSACRYRQKNRTFPRSFAVAPEIKPPIYSV